jgi:hypothetical protein
VCCSHKSCHGSRLVNQVRMIARATEKTSSLGLAMQGPVYMFSEGLPLSTPGAFAIAAAQRLVSSALLRRASISVPGVSRSNKKAKGMVRPAVEFMADRKYLFLVTQPVF